MRAMKQIAVIPSSTRHVIAAMYALIGWLMMVTGWSYLPWTTGPAELPSALKQLTTLFPLWVWGGAWFIAGVLAIITACTQLRRRWFAASMGAGGFMHLLWFVFYAIAYFGGDHRAYVTAAVYLRYAVAVTIVAILIAVLRPKVSR